MSLGAHLQELKKKHATLSQRVEEAQRSPSIDDLDLLFGFRWLWRNDPFSHFQFRRSARSAEQMFTFFDEYRVGFEAATVEFADDVAVLKVRTMMGADTIEQIQAAYARIAEQRPDALIIDLRGNGGGGYNRELLEQIAMIPGPVALVIDAGCISAGETLARDFRRYGAARLFGSPTAGSGHGRGSVAALGPARMCGTTPRRRAGCFRRLNGANASA